MRYLGILLVIGLVVYTVVDVVNAEDDDRLGVHPGLWIFGIVVFPPLGSIAWLALRFARRSRRRGASPAGGRPGGGTPYGPPRPVAPDDDPDFLWRLEQERRRREREGYPDDGPGSPRT